MLNLNFEEASKNYQKMEEKPGKIISIGIGHISVHYCENNVITV